MQEAMLGHTMHTLTHSLTHACTRSHAHSQNLRAINDILFKTRYPTHARSRRKCALGPYVRGICIDPYTMSSTRHGHTDTGGLVTFRGNFILRREYLSVVFNITANKCTIRHRHTHCCSIEILRIFYPEATTNL